MCFLLQADEAEEGDSGHQGAQRAGEAGAGRQGRPGGGGRVRGWAPGQCLMSVKHRMMSPDVRAGHFDLETSGQHHIS